jgi:hypothetical protein
MMENSTIFVYKMMQTVFLKPSRRVIASEPQATHDSTARIAKIIDAFYEDTGKLFDALGSGS